MTIQKFEVGGCVRDEIMGRQSKDVDYAVTGFDTFEEMAEWVKTQGEVFVVTPDTFTARARVGRDVFDFVWAREDGPYSDGRRPDWVKPAKRIEDDLARRDFTMNAIAKSEAGEIIDPFGGQIDIERRVIRAVGDPVQRFREDGLRIMRAVRFAVTLGFTIDTATAAAIRHHRSMVLRAGHERIRQEMTKAFAADTVGTFRWLEELQLTSLVFSVESGTWLKPTNEKRK